MTTLPTWAVWAISFGSPALAFIGVLVGQAVTRRGAREQETRSKREEVMRILRWASELAVSDDEAKVRLGVAQLGALLRSNILDENEKEFVQAALETVIREPVQQIERLGETAQVTALDEPVTASDADIASEVGDEEGSG